MTTKAADVLAPVSLLQPTKTVQVWELHSELCSPAWLGQKKTDWWHHPLNLTEEPSLLKSTQTGRWPTVPTAPRCVARSNTTATGGKPGSIYSFLPLQLLQQLPGKPTGSQMTTAAAVCIQEFKIVLLSLLNKHENGCMGLHDTAPLLSMSRNSWNNLLLVGFSFLLSVKEFITNDSDAQTLVAPAPLNT